MEKFSEFITEVKEKPYRILLLVHDTPDDPNKTGELLAKQAKKMKDVELYQFEVNKGYFSRNAKGNLVAHNYKLEKDILGKKNIEHDEKGWEIIPKNTIVILRGKKLFLFPRMLELEGVTLYNSIKCNDICNNKWHTYVILQKVGIKQPKTSVVTSSDLLEIPLKEIGNKFPLLIKTAQGTHGVGVILVESEGQLLSTIQLLYKLEEDIMLTLQEYIKTPYDVRAMYFNGEIIASLKRPIIKGDFRSNISQGNEPQKIKLTELEKSICIQASEAVYGYWVGVDFIPSANRETEPPYIIEVNGSPGTGYIDEINNINIAKLILDNFKNRDNWT